MIYYPKHPSNQTVSSCDFFPSALCTHADTLTPTQLYHMKGFLWNILQPRFEIQSSIPSHTVGLFFYSASDPYLPSRYSLPKAWDTAPDFHLGVIWLPPGSPWHIPGIQNSHFCIKAKQGKKKKIRFLNPKQGTQSCCNLNMQIYSVAY